LGASPEGKKAALDNEYLASLLLASLLIRIQASKFHTIVLFIGPKHLAKIYGNFYVNGKLTFF
jgi:hypothetical protein